MTNSIVMRRTFQEQLPLFYSTIPSHVLPTNATTGRHPFHRWFNFVAGFSPEFVIECIRQAGLKSNGCIIDPFAGCGTTNVEANLQGIRSVGFEAHIFLAEICRSKLLADADVAVIQEIYQELLEVKPRESASQKYSVPALTFLKKLIPDPPLSTLLSAREKVDGYKGQKFTFAYTILSKALDLCSHSKTDGIYKAPTSKKSSLEYAESLQSICNVIIEDLNFAHQNKIRNKARLLFQSSEDMSDIKNDMCDLLITSPPYLNNFDYAEMTRMYLYFWLHAADWGEITDKIRSKLIVNTTTALKGQKDKIGVYRAKTPSCVHEELDNYQKVLRENRKVKAGKKEYDFLIYPYFSQMTSVLNSAHSKLKPQAPAHIIVSDAALYGVHIQTEKILGAIMEDIGFMKVSIKKLRERGTRWILNKREGSKEGLGEFQITAYAGPKRKRVNHEL